MMGLVYAGRIASENLPGTGNSGTASVSSSSQGKYTDGTYTGSGQGYRGTTTVEVTVSGGNITDIMVISYADDDEFFNKAKNSVLNEILSSQSTDVATVSGATFSSSGLISAVADALSSSGNAETESTDASPEDAGASVGSSSGQNNSSNESGDTNAGQTENASSEENSVSSTDINPASLADGTYTGSGTGLRGATEVSVTVESGKITDITVTSYADDQQFFERAETTMIEEILSAQSIQASTVSGATFSSNSILEAVADDPWNRLDKPEQLHALRRQTRRWAWQSSVKIRTFQKAGCSRRCFDIYQKTVRLLYITIFAETFRIANAPQPHGLLLFKNNPL